MNARVFRKILIPVSVVLLTTSLIFMFSNEKSSQGAKLSKSIKIVKTLGETKIYESPRELQEDADVIAHVKASDKRKHVNQEPDRNGAPLWYWTETEVEIQNLQQAKQDLQVGDNITIYEPYTVFTDSSDQQVQMINEDYNPINRNQEYLIFLKKHEDGGYMPLGVYQGKVNITEPIDQSNEQLSLEVKKEFQRLLGENVVE
ncbi:hypothetical protein [Saccharibacillus sp. JS10]|uniref:hypothetical protein n=1 Tax=Saccharibacillus sp. JS10 TaxID=2950552 RepID=UPI00210CE069|nr:hypothetical protein [Saccharibacillus sp. JS10]MCQ4088504.1 hypothetical protein [Saccharibacillus sp. JS10]